MRPTYITRARKPFTRDSTTRTPTSSKSKELTLSTHAKWRFMKKCWTSYRTSRSIWSMACNEPFRRRMQLLMSCNRRALLWRKCSNLGKPTTRSRAKALALWRPSIDFKGKLVPRHCIVFIITLKQFFFFFCVNICLDAKSILFYFVFFLPANFAGLPSPGKFLSDFSRLSGRSYVCIKFTQNRTHACWSQKIKFNLKGNRGKNAYDIQKKFMEIKIKIRKKWRPSSVARPATVLKSVWLRLDTAKTIKAREIFEAEITSTNPWDYQDRFTDRMQCGSLFNNAVRGAEYKASQGPEDIVLVCDCSLVEFYYGSLKCQDRDWNWLGHHLLLSGRTRRLRSSLAIRVSASPPLTLPSLRRRPLLPTPSELKRTK